MAVACVLQHAVAQEFISGPALLGLPWEVTLHSVFELEQARRSQDGRDSLFFDSYRT